MKNEIAFETAEAALSTAKNMVEGGNYVVMLSREETCGFLITSGPRLAAGMTWCL